MEFPKQIKDIVSKLLEQPTLDNFREFLASQTGEHNPIDFKEKWIDKVALVKEMLSIANIGGGFIVFGIREDDEHTFTPIGLGSLRDKAEISNEVKNFISSDLKYDIYDFEYSTAEYKELQGKKFQMLYIEDTPEYLPFFSRRDGEEGSNKIFSDRIYIRRGTSCEFINENEFRQLIQRRLEHIYPNSGKALNLEQHLEQLRILYSKISKYKTIHKNSGINSFFKAIGETFSTLPWEIESVPNSLYPNEDYEEYLSRIIIEKKKRIERLLELK